MTKPKDETPPGFVLLGPTQRVLLCELGVDDKAVMDVRLHALMDREQEVEAEKKRVMDAINGRLTDIKSARVELHKTWKAGAVERLVEVRVYRDTRRGAGDIVFVRMDTLQEISRRPPSKEETQPELFGRGAGGQEPYVEELDTEDTATSFATAQRDHDKLVDELLAKVDLTSLLAQPEEPAPAAEPTPAASDGTPRRPPPAPATPRKVAKPRAQKAAGGAAKKTVGPRSRGKKQPPVGKPVEREEHNEPDDEERE